MSRYLCNQKKDRKCRDLDHDPLDDPAEPRGLLRAGHLLWALRGDWPARGMLGQHRRPLSRGRRAGRGHLHQGAAGHDHGPPVARRFRRGTGGADLRPPAARRRPDNGEWDYDVPLLPGDHVTDDAGTGFVHTAPSHGDDDYQIGAEIRPADDLQRAGGRQLSPRPAAVRRQGDPQAQRQGGRRQHRRHRQAGRGRRAAGARAAEAQLSAFLALQGAADLPQHAAMVRRHRQAGRRRAGPATAPRSANVPCGRSTNW